MKTKKLTCLFLTLIMIMSSISAVFAEPFYSLNESVGFTKDSPYSINLDEIPDLSPGGSYRIKMNITSDSTADGAIKVDIKDGDIVRNSTYGVVYLRKLGSNYRFFVNGSNKVAVSADMMSVLATEGLTIDIKWDTLSGKTEISASNSKGSVGPYTVENWKVTEKFGNLIISSSGNAELKELSFERDLRTFKISAAPAVGGEIEGAGEFQEGSEATLKAIPASGYIFGGWYFGDEFLGSEETLTVLVDSDKEYRAEFIKQFTVTAYAEPEEGGIVSGSGVVSDGEEVTLNISVNNGYSFFGWYKDDVKVSEDTEFKVVPDSDVTYVAKLKAGEIANFEIEAIPSDSVGGYVEGSGIYVEGESATLKAQAFSGYTFEGWFLNDELVSENAEYTFIPESSNVYVAKFEPIPAGVWIEDFSSMTASEWTNNNNAGKPWRHWNATSLVEVDGNKQLLVGKGNILAFNFATAGLEAGNKYIMEFDVLPKEYLEESGWALYQVYFEGGALGSLQTTHVYTSGAYNYHLNSLGSWISGIKATDVEMSKETMWHINVEWDTELGKLTVKQGPNGGGVYEKTTTVTGITDTSKLGEIKFSGYATPIYLDNFKITSYVSVKAEAGKYGTVYGSDKVLAGGEVTLSAIPDKDCTFDGWYLDGHKVSDEAEWTFNAYSKATYVAKFINPNPEYKILTNALPEEGGSVLGEGVYSKDSKVTLTAKPETGYVFEGWYEDVESTAVSIENPWSFFATEENDDKTYTAKFSNAGYTNLIENLKISVLQDKEAEFKKKITKENIIYMGFSTGYEEEIDFENIADLMWNELTEDDAITLGENVEDDFSVYETSVAVELLNEGKTDDATALLQKFIAEDEDFEEYFKTHVTLDSAKEYFTDFLKDADIEDFEMLKDKMTEALILTAVKYPDGPGSIKKIFREYSAYLDLSSVSSADSVWEGLIEEENFDDLEELMDKYKDLVSEAKNDSDKGSGGSGGGNSSTGSSGKVVTSGGGGTIQAGNVTSQAKKDTISMSFEDLNSVPWAYESISRMYEAKIINGVSDKEFRPDFSVMREEFVKMVVGAMGIGTSNAKSDFSDVINGAWYEGYVASAVDNGIINGMGDGRFGVGMEITRQDMAVIIYNAMTKTGKFTPKGAKSTFSDSDSIADYAKTAVAELSELGIIAGVGDGSFAPKSTATRAQAAVIIDRAFTYLR